MAKTGHLNFQASFRRRLLLVRLFSCFTYPRDRRRGTHHAMAIVAIKGQKRMNTGGSRDIDDLFNQLLKTKDESISYAQLVRTTVNLLTAGSDSTASALATATYLLLTHPECTDKLKREILDAFAGPEEISGDHTAKLEYLHAVIE